MTGNDAAALYAYFSTSRTPVAAVLACCEALARAEARGDSCEVVTYSVPIQHRVDSERMRWAVALGECDRREREVTRIDYFAAYYAQGEFTRTRLLALLSLERLTAWQIKTLTALPFAVVMATLRELEQAGVVRTAAQSDGGSDVWEIGGTYQ